MKQRILIIHDSIVEINALYIILRDAYQIVVAKDSKDGLAQAKNNKVSLILLNLLMPQLAESTVLERLKQDPVTRRIPIIVITGKNEEKNAEKGLEFGAVDYIAKPFSPRLIKAKIKTHIDLYVYRCQIEEMARLDGLTGVPNRRSYEENVKEYWESAYKEQAPVSIAIMDIDCFKEYNDHYGHLEGDRVLRQVATELKRKATDNGGYLARFGGEEFVSLFLGSSAEKANAAVEEMRQAVEQLGIEHLYSRAKQVVTISAGGITEVPAQESFEDIVNRADQRLYRAKYMGRNCTVWKEFGEEKGQIEVFLLGKPKVLAREGEFSGCSKGKVRIWLLLAFLIENRYKEYTKEQLISAVYPYEETEQAELVCKTVLEETRKELEVLKGSLAKELIIPINGIYHWNTNYMCIVDTELFENLYHEALGEQQEEKRYELCERAISLYKNPFLSPITTVEWVAKQQAEYREKYEELFACLLALCDKKKEYEKIIRLCQRELYEERFEEKVQYYYLKALMKLGQNHLALNHYEYMVESYGLMLEQGVPEEFESLYQEIVNASDRRRKSIGETQAHLKEQRIPEGAYYCSLYVFQAMYQLAARRRTQKEEKYSFALLFFERDRYYDDKQLAIRMHALARSIKHVLEPDDVFCKESDCQYAILLSTDSLQETAKAMEQIIARYHKENGEEEVLLSYETAAVQGSEILCINR